ncbi:hypothetical protein SAMN04488061_2776 [Filomicrobium insigne]|uniref:Uncharacterized protein n=1 Tax=Filomicrobium insigne TaxID=418854 RepID=A0A1H0S8T4_9HYPH|nr:hypothetical protein SAMN04488061_2776 [Filomicrobium insigne]
MPAAAPRILQRVRRAARCSIRSDAAGAPPDIHPTHFILLRPEARSIGAKPPIFRVRVVAKVDAVIEGQHPESVVNGWLWKSVEKAQYDPMCDVGGVWPPKKGFRVTADVRRGNDDVHCNRPRDFRFLGIATTAA